MRQVAELTATVRKLQDNLTNQPNTQILNYPRNATKPHATNADKSSGKPKKKVGPLSPTQSTKTSHRRSFGEKSTAFRANAELKVSLLRLTELPPGTHRRSPVPSRNTFIFMGYLISTWRVFVLAPSQYGILGLFSNSPTENNICFICLVAQNK